MLCTLESALTESQMSEIKKFESEAGINLLAFRCFKSNPAILDKEKLARLQEIEKQLGICLVAISSK